MSEVAIGDRNQARLPSQGTGGQTLRAVAWLVFQSLGARAVGIVSQLGLAALLSPSDFGLIGLAYGITNLGASFVNIGIDDIVVQRGRALRFWIGPALWISIAIALLVASITVAVSPYLARAYNAPSLTGLICILSLSMPASAIAVVAAIVFKVRMRFGFMAAYGIAETIVQAALTIAFARIGFGAYSFALPVLLGALVKAAVWWQQASGSLRFHPNLSRWKYVLPRTSYSSFSRLLLAVVGQADYIIIGLFASKAEVGAYYFGFRLAAQPLWMLAGNISGVLNPVLAGIKAEPLRQGHAALKVCRMLAYCIMPAAFIQAFIAGPAIEGLFGPRWSQSVPVIQLLSIGLAIDALSWVAGSLIVARGEFKAGAKYLAIQTPIFIALVYLGAHYKQSVGAAAAVCLYYAITQPPYVIAVFRRISVKPSEILGIYTWPIAYAAASTTLAWALSSAVGLAALPLTRAVFIGTSSALLYAVLLRLLEKTIWSEVTGCTLGLLTRKANVALA